MSTTHATVILAAVLSTLTTESAYAQQRPTAEDTYDAEKRNEWVAAGLELVLPTVPTLGHAYAGDWKRGIPPATLRMGGLAFSMYSFFGCSSEDDEVCSWLGVGGGFVFLGGLAWGVVSAYHTARDGNRALRERLGIQSSFALGPVVDVQPGRSGGSRTFLGIRVQF